MLAICPDHFSTSPYYPSTYLITSCKAPLEGLRYYDSLSLSASVGVQRAPDPVVMAPPDSEARHN